MISAARSDAKSVQQTQVLPARLTLLILLTVCAPNYSSVRAQSPGNISNSIQFAKLAANQATFKAPASPLPAPAARASGLVAPVAGDPTQSYANTTLPDMTGQNAPQSLSSLPTGAEVQALRNATRHFKYLSSKFDRDYCLKHEALAAMVKCLNNGEISADIGLNEPKPFNGGVLTKLAIVRTEGYIIPVRGTSNVSLQFSEGRLSGCALYADITDYEVGARLTAQMDVQSGRALSKISTIRRGHVFQVGMAITGTCFEVAGAPG